MRQRAPRTPRLKRRALARSEDAIERRRFASIDGEPVGAAHLEHARCEPAPVLVRHPLRGVLPALLVPVHPWRGEREVTKVAREPGLGRRVPRAQTRIVGLARSHDVLDVGLGGGCETRAGVLRSPRRIRAGRARNLRDRRRARGRPDTSRAPAHARRRGLRRRCVFCKLFDPPRGATRARAPARKAPTRPAFRANGHLAACNITFAVRKRRTREQNR